MALDSSSPFGVIDGTLSKGKSLFANSTDVSEVFTFPFATSPYSNTLHANTVLNASHSKQNDGGKFDMKTSMLSLNDKIKLRSVHGILSERCENEKSSDVDSSKCESKEVLANCGITEGGNEVSNKCIDYPGTCFEDDLSDNDDIVECGNCDNEFQTMQEYMDHKCACNPSAERMSSNGLNVEKRSNGERKLLSDVENFQGKIVYNPDGSAYIIEGDSDNDIESIIDLPKKEGIIVDKRGSNFESFEKDIPHIDNAVFVPRNQNSYFNGTFIRPHKLQPTPIIHSYRVYDLRSGKDKSQNSGESMENHCNFMSSVSRTAAPSTSEPSSSVSPLNLSPSYVTSVPMKPILMCFICKLSFGFSKSFMSHAINEHKMELTLEEKEIMSRKHSSAIIQGTGKDKEPLMSFLDPIKSSVSETGTKTQIFDKTASVKSGKPIAVNNTTMVSYIYTKPKISDSFTDSYSHNNQVERKDLSIREIRDQLGQLNHINSGSNTLNAVNDETLASDKNYNSDFTAVNLSNDSRRAQLDSSDDSNSQSSFQRSPMNKYMSEDFNCQSPGSFLLPFTSSQHQGFFGVCEEHLNGRAQGVECQSCDIMLSASQSFGSHMSMMHSRNSCKTLKCPKCNWHYKYQETLEIHMKEKHPEGDQKCMYCMTSQTHPRLVRGESYSCGYKPYRCEICNYSTTTKGNLSIHMQSDKHLNNVQDLSNMGGSDIQQFNKPTTQNNHQQSQIQQPHTPTLPPSSQALTQMPPHQQLLQQQNQQPSASQQHVSSHALQDITKKIKPKPTWRCDICNYETNVARNLRIHMTSEKHTHNMMVLQQNMKHMQRDIQIHQLNQLVMLQDPSFLGLTGPIPGGLTIPYDGSLMIGGLPAGFGQMSVDLSKENCIGIGSGLCDGDQQDVNKLFQCCICNIFGTDSLDMLHQHLQLDRSKAYENENISMSSGTYMCNLCMYKTNLKANFQLHCKTDKHIQRLQLVNHIKEGGANNEWRLKYLNVSNPIQVRCNACDYNTNSIHKLQIHTGNPHHEPSAQLFCHLLQQENVLDKPDMYYYCTLCKFNARTKLSLMQHVHSMQHLHSENMKQIEMKEKGQVEIDIGEIFMVKEIKDRADVTFDDEAFTATNGSLDEGSSNFTEPDIKDRVKTPLSPLQTTNNNNNTIKQAEEDPTQKGDAKGQEKVHECPYCNYSSLIEMHIKTHVADQHPNRLTDAVCPLCQEPFTDLPSIQKHLIVVHNVNTEGLHRLLALVEDSNIKMAPASLWEMSVPSSTIALAKICEVNLDALEMESCRVAAENAIDTSAVNDKDLDEQFRCQTCSKSYTNIDQLYSHQNELGHLELMQTPRGPGYLCWKKGCNQYFKTAQALQMHFREIHAKSMVVSSAERSEYRFQCQICTLAFKSQHKLHFHSQMHVIKSAISCNLCTKSFQSIALLSRHVVTSHDLGEGELEQYRAEIYANALAFSSFMTDPKLSRIFSVSDLPKENIKVSKISSFEREMKENGDMDLECNNSPVSSPIGMENGIDMENKSEEMDIVDNDLSSNDQQFIENYINSQTFAEGTFDDPNRKFKCHKCRVAFTKQHYLTAHNKSLTHRKGEKINYPLEKFLDPNRPYKCEICKESFTQKNILLVHYNSVSHLHKLKQQSTQSDSTLMTNTASTASSLSQSSTTMTSPAVSADKACSKKSIEAPPKDESVRPFKCNICKVSYSQSSALDIHLRSVAHQSRSSNLHELAMKGEIDLSRMQNDEPMDNFLQAQQTLLNEYLTNQTSLAQSMQSSLFFQGLPGLTSYPGYQGLPSMFGFPFMTGLPPLLPLSLPSHMLSTSTPISTSSHSKSSSPSIGNTRTLEAISGHKSQDRISQQSSHADKGNHVTSDAAKIQLATVLPATSSDFQNLTSGNIHICQRCSSVFASQDVFIQHQLLCSGSCTSPSSSPGSRSRFTGRVKMAVQRNLLENFGFECVMQFNEFNQQVVNREVKDYSNVEPDDIRNSKEPCDNTKKVVKAEKNEVKENFTIDLPEMNRCVCNYCRKQFSSVWVLKTHKEEVHKEIVPLQIVEEVGDKFKNEFEKKVPKEIFPADHHFTPLTSITTPGLEEKKSPKQEMPPPLPPPSQMQMEMLQMMNMFNMGMMPMSMPLLMSTQSSLMPMMMPSPGMDIKPGNSIQSVVDQSAASLNAQQKRHIEHMSMSNQKRARTRINDEQLKVLRGYFDINNSPAEEQIQAMSDQTGLPMKVIKHWFRNTLFKERQRNKDSPYNFNNPPSTTLDLEEYEKTGKVPTIEYSSPPLSKSPSPALKLESEIKKVVEIPEKPPKIVTQSTEIHEIIKAAEQESSKLLTLDTNLKIKHEKTISNNAAKTSTSSLLAESPSTTYATSIPITSSISPLLTSPGTNECFVQNFASGLSGISTPNYPPRPTTPTSTPMYDSHSYSPPSGSSGRRANRTRFTDYQVKCLQEYFEQNAYPKDDELEQLSKMLGLSPRVIVVWFQNARQKARKIYENQPTDNLKDNSFSSSSYGRTGALNYQCKKCQAVFQRYYDLIRHQKRSCFTESEKLELQFLSDDSDSMSNLTSYDNTAFSDSDSDCSDVSRSVKEINISGNGDSSNYHCTKCNQFLYSYELFCEHQSLHTMSSIPYLNPPGSSAFSMLQNMASSSQLQGHGADDHSPAKRKYEDEEDDPDQPRDKRLRTTILPEQLDYLYQKYQVDCNPSRKQLEAISKDVGLKKRVVQVWFQNTRARERKGQYRAHQQLIHKRCPICRALFRAKSALESHLATKHPDEMAKGDINIDNIPDAAIESPGPSSSSMISQPPDYNKFLAPPAMQGLLPYMPPVSLSGLGFPPMTDPIQMSMKQFCEDSFKKYIHELSSTSHTPQKSNSFTASVKPETTGNTVEEDAPLDLSKPLKVSTHSESENPKDGPTSQSSFSSGQSSQGGQSERHQQSGRTSSLNSILGERNRPTSGAGSINSILGSDIDEAYMMNRFNRDNSIHNPDMEDELSNASSPPTSPGGHISQTMFNSANKRYRTQMTSLQVKIMKMIFTDYKTPMMAECEMLGRVIGLQKRVVQVWFQNARAKEKKAKLSMSSYAQSELDFPKPPEECTLCCFKYSHKYTIQDHIFTKKHIDKVRAYIQSQSAAEREMTTSAGAIAGVSGLLRSQQANDVEHMRQLMEEASTCSHLAQLQSFGLAPLGLPPGAMAGMGLLPTDFLHKTKQESCLKKEGKENNSKPESSSSMKEAMSNMSADGGRMPFGGLLPGMDTGMLPFMYHGLSGLLPGIPPLPHGFMPGAAPLIGYDPMTYGTPLALLQIPQQAIKDVSSKLNDPKATIGEYTQDCKSISSLRSLVSSVDYNCAQEATVDVGYICKKCQLVYPAKDACVTHQRMMCFAGGKYPDSIRPMLKLLQIQYKCKVCLDKVSTVHEFKIHCDTECHKKKLLIYQQQRHTTGTSAPKNSVPMRTTPSPRRTEDNDRRSHTTEPSTPKNSMPMRTTPSPRRTEDNDQGSTSEICGKVDI